MRNRKLILFILLTVVLKINAQQASKIVVIDTRSTVPKPTDYNSEVKFEFKNRESVSVGGAGYYSGLMTFAPWRDYTGNKTHQINFNDGGLFYRNGNPDNTEWNPWREILISDSNGNVGIGTSNPESNLEIHGANNPSFTLKDTNLGNRVQFGIANGNGAFATYAKQSDVILRTIGTKFFHINHSWGSSDGSGGITIGDNTNGRTLNVFNNGKVTVGTTDPTLLGKFNVNGELLVQNGWLRVKGQKGLYFQDYGGGFYMQDNTWIRTYNNKSFYHNSGIMRTDGTFQVGSGGNRFIVNSSGDVGIGNTSPNAGLDIKKEGIGLELDHTTSGGHTMIKFNSVVNNGSDKAFILFQDESKNNPGSGGEDVRLTMGVYNDFRASGTHSDELWLQGGGRLVQNVGNWDAELNAIIGTPSTGKTGGYEWRINDTPKMLLSHDAKLTMKGSIIANEIEVREIAATNINLAGDLAANNITITANGQTADFVFEEDYQLKDLSEVESFILTNKHLPDIPSAAQMEEQGVNLAEMNKLLLQKVEELTLYSIEMEKARKMLEKRLARLEELITNNK